MSTSSPLTGTTQPYKALLAFVLSFLGTLWASINGREDLDTLGWHGWLTIIISALVVALGVFLVPNPPKARGALPPVG